MSRKPQLGRLVERWFGPAVLVAFALAMVLGLQSQLNHATVVHGAGASFPAPIYHRWAALYERDHGVTIEYEAVGSGAGIDAITEQEVDFGASDARMSGDELEEAPGELLQIPTVLGPVVLAYNLPGLDDDLVLDSATIVAIYQGEITEWDDPQIAALNPGLDLPGDDIRVVHRADRSGTSYIFTDYLSSVDDTWASEIGRSKDPEWPAGSGGNGNGGVAQQVLVRPGGIGYIELAYAENTGLDFATIVNQAGAPVRPTAESVQAAERNAATDADGLKPSLVDSPGDESYPLVSYTYLLMYRDLTEAEHAESAHAAVEFVTWALTDGQDEVSDLGYSPLPDELAAATLAAVEEIELPDH